MADKSISVLVESNFTAGCSFFETLNYPLLRLTECSGRNCGKRLDNASIISQIGKEVEVSLLHFLLFTGEILIQAIHFKPSPQSVSQL